MLCYEKATAPIVGDVEQRCCGTDAARVLLKVADRKGCAVGDRKSASWW